MCWSFGASAALATAGVGTSGYMAKNKQSKLIWIPILYFSVMELLQALTYFYIDKCDVYMNHLLTVIGVIHIAFQPFFINAISLYFVPARIRKKVAPWAFTICFFGTVGTLVKLYPFHLVTGSAAACISGVDTMCGSGLCSVSGSWHLAWNVPLSLHPNIFYTYYVPAFIVPIIYGSWRMTIYHCIFGPALAWILTKNPNEWPAVWCLLSVGYILVAWYTPLREKLKVKKWFLWRR